MSKEKLEGVILFPKGHLLSFAQRLYLEDKHLLEGRAKAFPIIPYGEKEGIMYYMLDVERMYDEAFKNGTNTTTMSNGKVESIIK